MANLRESTKAKYRELADLYRGSDDDNLRGNGKACYKALYPKASEKVCEAQASKILNHPYTQEYLQARRDEVTKAADITERYVLETIQDTIERCRQAKPVMKNGEPVYVETEDGELVPAYTFDASNVLKGSELLGKHLKMFTDKVDLAGDINHRYAISDEPEQSSDEWLSNHKPK